MFKECDVIRAKFDLSEMVPRGCLGTVLIVFDEPSLAYEVEFVDDNDQTLELLTVMHKDIERCTI